MSDSAQGKSTTICVFCGANSGQQPLYAREADQLAQELVQRGASLVYGGGSVGLMGVIASGVAKRGGRVTGILPRALQSKELAGDNIGTLHLVDSMSERKEIMVQLSDAFIAMPGGFGTMDELFEVITWGQLGILSKPIGLLNVAGYWDPIIAWIDHAAAQGFIREAHRELVIEDADPGVLLDRLAAHEMPKGLTNGMDWGQR